MKVFTYVILCLGLVMIVINVLILDFSNLFEGDSLVALIGIVAAICAIVLTLILFISKKINKKLNS